MQSAMQLPPADAPRYVHLTDRFEATAAAWTRLGFAEVRGWGRGNGVRSALFRAGPALVELVDAAELRPEPGYAAAVAAAISGR